MVRKKIIIKDKLFEFMLNNFDPASSLWRAFEIQQVIDALRSITDTGLILDLGCGEGKITELVFGKNNEVVGLDSWHKALASAKMNSCCKSVLIADARRMPFVSGSFNIVFSNSVIEHINGLDLVLQEVGRILKPNGIFLFTVPTDKFGDFLFFYDIFNRLSLKKSAKWYKEKRNKLLNHFNLLNGGDWKAKLARYGFNVKGCKNYISKETLRVWDLIAAFGFIFNKIKPGFLSIFLKALSRKEYYRLKRIEAKLTIDESAGLLIIAAKA